VLNLLHIVYWIYEYKYMYVYIYGLLELNMLNVYIHWIVQIMYMVLTFCINSSWNFVQIGVPLSTECSVDGYRPWSNLSSLRVLVLTFLY